MGTMFQVMGKLRMPNSFIKMIQVLFYDARVSININNQTIELLKLHRGVRQGCALAPYLFIIMAEPLHTTLTHGMRIGSSRALAFLNAIPNKSSANMLTIRYLR